QSVTNAIVANAKTQTAIQLVLASFRSNIPQYSVEVDRVKTQAMHVSLDQVFAALGSYLGSSYVDQFNKFGRVLQIYVQARSPGCGSRTSRTCSSATGTGRWCR